MLSVRQIMKKKRPILQDVANRVGVTKMTVSRYLRNPAQVSTKLGERIALVLDELGYIPNRVPDMLSNATSRAIGVLLPSLTNHVFSEVLKGIESITDPGGYQTLVSHFGYSAEKEERQIRSLLSWNIDGIILTERQHTAPTFRMLETAGIPIVEIMDSSSPYLDMAVGFNNYDASRQMVEQMLKRGYRNIAYIGARLDERTLQRKVGYEQAMQAMGLPVNLVMSEQASSFSTGGALLREAQRRYPQLDSIFCTNDDLAIGAMFECQRQGIEVPKKIAIAGFHGHDIARNVAPPLATVATPRYKIGVESAVMLIKTLQGQKPAVTCLDLGFDLLLDGSL